jgi:hypothetical protein
LFNVPLGQNVRLDGEAVFDSISGATPSGAPAYKDWNTSASVYSSQYAEQNFGYLRDDPSLIGNPVGWTNYVIYGVIPSSGGTIDPGSPSNQIYQATQQYLHSFTNSPNFGSSRIPTTEMRDFRASVSLRAPIAFGHNTLTPQFSYSEESDYVSIGGALNYSRDFNNRNTTITLGWSHNADSVKDDLGMLQAKDSDDFFIGVNQLLSPNDYITANVSYGCSDGYLNDPYRGIYAANALLTQDTGFTDPNGVPVTVATDGWRLENRPRHKEKIITYLSYVRFISAAAASVETSYRFYHDTYGVNGHTFDVAWHQKIGRNVVLSPSFRYYRQSAADIYYYAVPDYNNWPQYYSADYRLSELESFTYGIRLTWRVQKWLSVDATYDRYIMQGLDGVTAQAAYPSANLFGFGARLWF